MHFDEYFRFSHHPIFFWGGGRRGALGHHGRSQYVAKWGGELVCGEPRETNFATFLVNFILPSVTLGGGGGGGAVPMSPLAAPLLATQGSHNTYLGSFLNF